MKNETVALWLGPKWRMRLVVLAALLVIFLITVMFAHATQISQPVWWQAAQEASHDAWIRSYQCHCEQAFAIDLRGESIIVRVFQQADERSISHITLNPETVAVFHTHPDNPLPSRHDKEVESRTKIPIYVVYYSIITEAK